MIDVQNSLDINLVLVQIATGNSTEGLKDRHQKNSRIIGKSIFQTTPTGVRPRPISVPGKKTQYVPLFTYNWGR